MGNLSGDISKAVFRQKLEGLRGEASMNGQMLELLTLFDGRTSLGEVLQKTNITLSQARVSISQLIAHGVIEKVQGGVAMLEPQFFGYMAGHLSRIAGPMAKVIVEDAVLEISNNSSQVPVNRAGELIEMVGRQIPDVNMKAEFIQNMLQKILQG